jgi:hypothetical protein
MIKQRYCGYLVKMNSAVSRGFFPALGGRPIPDTGTHCNYSKFRTGSDYTSGNENIFKTVYLLIN